MSRLLFLAVLFAAVAFADGELPVGSLLPEVRGEYLSKRQASLPKDCAGRVTLVLFGFSYDSRFAVEAWTKRFRGEFGTNPRVTFFEVPMIGGMARLGKWFIDSGMRRGTPEADHENVITVYGGTDAWKQRLGVTDPTFAYAVLLDAKGSVVWRHNGAFEEMAYQALQTQVEKLLRD